MNLFDINKLEKEQKELENQTTEDGFWNDTKKSTKILSQIKSIKLKTSKYNQIRNEIINLQELSELVELETDTEMAKEVIKNTR